jgi:hypothetical protein
VWQCLPQIILADTYAVCNFGIAFMVSPSQEIVPEKIIKIQFEPLSNFQEIISENPLLKH